VGFKFPDVTKPETIEKKYAGKISKEGLEMMRGLLEMDPTSRLSAKQALMHPFFDGLRTAAEEEQVHKDRATLKRVESSTNPRVTGTMSRNGDQSRSRSGLRNNKIMKPGTHLNNVKRFNN
jgi:serine/threonine protein kinase